MTVIFAPLFPHAEQLDIGVTYINQYVMELDSSINDAAYSYELAIEYLSENKFNANNFKSIRSELNLLFNWAWVVKHISISDIDRVQLRKFIDFCNQPPSELITQASYPFFIQNKQDGTLEPNPKWRPFVMRREGRYVRKTSTLKAQLSLLSGFFLFLSDMEYVDKNPAAVLLRRLNVNNTHVVESSDGEKALSDGQWKRVWQHVNHLANTQPEKHQRTRLLFALLYLLYPRVSEIAARPGYTPMMSSFTRHRSGHWVFKIPRSKGGKSRLIPCPDELMQCLRAYRQYLGLTDYPAPHEQVPLFVRHRAGTHGRETGILNAQLGIEAIRDIVRLVFDEVADSQNSTVQEAHELNELREFSVHSLRHTGITTSIAAGTPLQVVMKNAGHADLSTLSVYISTDIQQQAEATVPRAL
ncbi:Tyrosine recombinase XerC [Paraglaciecola mesophila]|uniref:Tyrosine recombinase XerC n=1 Tax=Paraglaciecola mesophila TaxID=197222 RepID=A0A857JH13_9ALTE|nr:site-specific integrase [Paraglaciecola mesophila]QHJ10251.1 Tyrosine recombinase XerC [Paraglaciecola mesophila]